MSKTFIYNNKKYDFYGSHIEVNGSSDTWDFTVTIHDTANLKELITAINSHFDSLLLTDTPHFNIDNFDNISLVHSDETTLYDDVIGMDFTIEGNLNLQYVMGVYDRIQETLVSFNSTVSTLPFSGFSRLKVRYSDTLQDIYKVHLGITNTVAYQIKRLGSDYISYSGIESNTYNSIGGFTHKYRLVASYLQEYNSFINACIDNDVSFENDNNNIGRGFTYWLQAHKSDSLNIIYDYLDVIELEFSLLKQDDFITL